jgi:alpha-D-xyloside xylohydrolase
MQRQPLSEVRVYPGASGTFTLYDDDGVTNAYKAGGGRSAVLRWDDASRRLTADGKLPTGQSADALVKVMRP